MKLTLFGKVAFLAVAILVLTHTGFSQASQTWQVQKYDLTVKQPGGVEDRSLEVTAKLKLRNIGATNASSLTLRISTDAEVSIFKIDSESREINRSQEKVGNATLQRIQTRLTPIRSGEEIEAEVGYRFKVQDNGPLSSLTPLSSQFLPLSFWYPTPNSWFFARGADYAPMMISFTGEGGRRFVSSGFENPNGFISNLKTQPFFLSGSWDNIEFGGAEFLIPKGATSEERRIASEILVLINEARNFFSQKLGSSPEDRLRVVAVRRGGGFSSGGTILLDEAALRRGKIDSQTFMMLSEAVVKMFLSDGFRITGDGHGFIREGLPRFLATKFLENKFGKEIASTERIRQRSAYSPIASRDGAMTQLSPLDDIYYNSSANKGAMIWRLFERDLGDDFIKQFLGKGKQIGNLTIAGMRSERQDYSRYFGYFLDEVTNGNLLAGIPQSASGKISVALRNTMPIAVIVRVRLMTEDGGELFQSVQVPGSSFGQAIFDIQKTALRAEVDPDGLFVQSDYSDDIAPRRFAESDLLLPTKRAFDRQEFASAETLAKEVLAIYPKMDEIRVLLARALFAQGKLEEARNEFLAVEAANFVTARSIAWTALGLGEIAERRSELSAAASYFELALRSEGELGAVLLARQARIRTGRNLVLDESIKTFFQQFDRAAVSNRKSEIDALIVKGEVGRFSAGLSGQSQQWSTSVIAVDRISDSSVLVETRLVIKLLNRNQEQGSAIFRLVRLGNEWKLDGVEFFDVR
jgi:hypothetical protein